MVKHDFLGGGSNKVFHVGMQEINSSVTPCVHFGKCQFQAIIQVLITARKL